MADEQLHQAYEFGDEKYEGEDEEAKKSVSYNFTNNVAIEDAHDGKGQCNMGREWGVRSRQSTVDSLQLAARTQN